MELKFLGRGSAFNIKEGNTSAYYKNEDSMFLIDCGENIFTKIMEQKLLEGVKYLEIAITHFHPDHAGSLGSLIFYCNFGVKEKIEVTIHFPDKEIVRNYLLYNGVYENLYSINDLGLVTNSNLNVDGLYFIENNHEKITEKTITEYKHGNNNDIVKNIFKSYSILISTNLYKGLILYSGDCKMDEYFIDNYINNEFEDDENDEYKLLYKNIYLECSLKESEMHTSIDIIDKYVSEELKPFIKLMHIDCDELIEEANKRGLQVVEI